MKADKHAPVLSSILESSEYHVLWVIAYGSAFHQSFSGSDRDPESFIEPVGISNTVMKHVHLSGHPCHDIP